MKYINKITICFLLIICCFYCINISAEAKIKSLGEMDRYIVCNYENHGDNFHIMTKYSEDNKLYSYLFSFSDDISLGVKAEKLEFGATPNIGSSNKKIRELYISKQAASSIKKLTETNNIPDKNIISKYCPRVMQVSKDYEVVCLAMKEKDYCKKLELDSTYNLVPIFTNVSQELKDSLKSTNKKKVDYTSKPAELSTASCNSVLGSADDEMDPAYYLDKAFSAIKYISIVVLIVLSMMDYLKSVVSKDDDMLKKATNNFFVRLILCIVIFIAPILIKIILQFANIVDADMCGIGR